MSRYTKYAKLAFIHLLSAAETITGVPYTHTKCDATPSYRETTKKLMSFYEFFSQPPRLIGFQMRSSRNRIFPTNKTRNRFRRLHAPPFLQNGEAEEANYMRKLPVSSPQLFMTELFRTDTPKHTQVPHSTNVTVERAIFMTSPFCARFIARIKQIFAEKLGSCTC